MKIIIEKLLDKEDLYQQEACDLMLGIMSGDYNDAEIAGFLIALRAKGETSKEIAGFAQAMRKKMTVVNCIENAIDMCGTGGDSSGTFNISTAATFIVSAAGIPVAKHGNRSMTSKSGSADVLSALGVDIMLPNEKVSECIEKIGIGFMFAPSLHPAMKYAMGARLALSTRTVFNILGPLCNPANVKRQLMGIYNGELTEKVANVLKILGSIDAMVVHGNDGLDEITTTTSTKISHLKQTKISTSFFKYADYGFKTSSLKDLQGGSPKENADIIVNILHGVDIGYKSEIVILNAAAGIIVGGKADCFEDAISISREVLKSGAALDKLKQLSKFE